jgi:hypothetical protein
VISILDFRKQKFSRMVLLALEEDTWERVGFLKCAIRFYRIVHCIIFSVVLIE